MGLPPRKKYREAPQIQRPPGVVGAPRKDGAVPVQHRKIAAKTRAILEQEELELEAAEAAAQEERERLRARLPEYIREIRRLAGQGVPLPLIAVKCRVELKVPVTVEDLSPGGKLADEVAMGELEVLDEVSLAVKQRAIEGKVPADGMFFMKARAKWRETHGKDAGDSGNDFAGFAIEVVPTKKRNKRGPKPRGEHGEEVSHVTGDEADPGQAEPEAESETEDAASEGAGLGDAAPPPIAIEGRLRRAGRG